MLDVGTILDLSDGHSYSVISNVIYQDKEYLYLVDIDNNSNMIFVFKNGDLLEIVHDTKLIENLILKINSNYH